ncbi:glucose PTS transporter subunit IIA [Rothia aerolata]|uniref:PTS beta-glucoside transporter subunit IIABC n=1 Tax=Rothia aerolata TaxID=1812262 RepID=A0A917IV67_9MICC|nr:PTS glucose transporter subunit IIABC [Rothia aerolata]GGH64558.1 PTS beta-glucoside transporter subunit IIABC [Rothia aerolata]
MANEPTVSILAPMAGEVVPLDQVDDPVFSSGKLGSGFGVNPTADQVVAPVSGKVSMVAGTKHAIGIKADSGLEILLHLGIDTVELDGLPFINDLGKGDRVEAGQPIATMDLAKVRQAGKGTTAILAVTNTPKALENLDVHTGTVSAGDSAATATVKGQDAADSATSAGAGSTAAAGGAAAASSSTSAAGAERPGHLKGHDALAWDILNNIGGAENVKSVIHCITRVRFYLKDDSKAKDEVVSNLDGVIDVARAGGQYQVVIGPAVEDVYDAVVKQLPSGKAGGETESEVEPEERPSGALGWLKWGFSSLIGVITGSMMPVIGLLAASGVLKGILTLLTIYEVVDVESQTYQIINAMGDAVFYFLPIFVGFTAAKRLGADPIIVSIIGGVLAYPALVEMAASDPSGSILGVSTNAEFFGIPFPMASYTYSIFPMIVAAWLCAKIEPALKKAIPAVLRMIFVPLIEVFVVSALILVVLGPIIMFISNGLAAGIQWVYDLNPAISGLIIGAFYQCLVIFGLHWAVIPLIADSIASQGYSYLNAIISATMVAQGAGALAVFAKTKNEQMKGLSGSAAIAGFCGITEPAMYGINLKYGRVFMLASVGAAVGGFITGLMNVNMWGFVGSLIGFTSFINPDGGFDNSWYGFWIASAATVIVSFTLVYLFGFKDTDLAHGRTVEKKRLGKR